MGDAAADKLKTRARRLSEAKLDKTADKIDRAARRISEAADRLRQSEPMQSISESEDGDTEVLESEDGETEGFGIDDEPITDEEISAAHESEESMRDRRPTEEQMADFSRENSLPVEAPKVRASDESSIHTTNEARTSDGNWSPHESEEDMSANDADAEASTSITNGNALAASLAFFDQERESDSTTIPSDLQSIAASDLEHSVSVEPTSFRNGVLVGEEPRERAATDESIEARQRSDSEEAAAKFQIQVEEPISGAEEEESDAEESVDSADASSLVADATRARTDPLTVADAYDRIEDDDESDEEEHEEAIDEDSQSQKKVSIMDLIDDDEDSTSSKMEGAEETEVETSDDSEPSPAAESP